MSASDIPSPAYIAAMSTECSRFTLQVAISAALIGVLLGAGIVATFWWLS